MSQEMQQYNTSTAAMIFSGDMLEKMQSLANLMSTSKVTVPAHFRGQPGDCLAVVMQAMQWQMNPYACAQKTHLVNGTLGYEAQLVNAVIQSSGAIKGRFHYEYQGEGQNILCRVGAIPKDEDEVVWTEWLSSSSVTTKNSPLWKTNTKQQMGYLQVKNWGRLYCPGAILGVYSVDELETIPSEKEINPSVTESAANVSSLSKIDELLLAIKTMSINDFKSIDPAPFSKDEKAILRNAMEARRDEITLSQKSNVVADVVAERVVETPVNWESSIKECGDYNSLNILLKDMPQEVQLEYGDLIDEQSDFLRSK
jgi:hypothetical protein